MRISISQGISGLIAIAIMAFSFISQEARSQLASLGDIEIFREMQEAQKEKPLLEEDQVENEQVIQTTKKS